MFIEHLLRARHWARHQAHIFKQNRHAQCWSCGNSNPECSAKKRLPAKRGAFTFMFSNWMKASAASFWEFIFSISWYPERTSVLSSDGRKVMQPSKRMILEAREPQFPCNQRLALSTSRADQPWHSLALVLSPSCHHPACALPKSVSF